MYEYIKGQLVANKTDLIVIETGVIVYNVFYPAGRIPMLPAIRSLNLANSVAIVLYEALRQNGFHEMERSGELHRLKWRE